MGRKKAIITGAEIGMGRGIALVLAEEGYDIAFSYYPKAENVEASIETTMAGLKAHGAQGYYFPADLSEPDAPRAFFEKAVESLGGLDLLVNNAGVNIPLPLQDISEANFDYLVSLDLRAYVMMMHYAARYIKSCLNRMAEAFALDLAPYGIRVNNGAPGAVRVRSDEELLSISNGRATDYFWSKDFLTKPELVKDHDFRDQLGPRIPLGRVGLPEDIGRAIAFLASEKASYITGVTLRIDGGLILPGMPEDSSMISPEKGW